MTRVLVCGGRDFNDPSFIFRHLVGLHEKRGITAIIEGGAKGVDKFAKMWAEGRGIPVASYPADWMTDGKAAGPKRNARMIRFGMPDLVIAFPGGKGTANMVAQARAAGIEVIEITK